MPTTSRLNCKKLIASARLHTPPERACNRTRMEEDISRILFKQQSILSACLHADLCDLPAASNGPFSCGCIFGLAPGGVCRAACLAARRGELLPRHFTLTPRLRSGRRPVLQMISEFDGENPSGAEGRYIFCCTFHRLAAPGCYPAPSPAVFGLSSPPVG